MQTPKQTIPNHSTVKISGNRRIDSLDGLRALAALGVLWIHCWILHENPRLYLGPLDIASVIAIGGNGVDLFFVISGFCMYYFYGLRSTSASTNFWVFLQRRWRRLSPLFYTATVVYILFGWARFSSTFGIPELFTSIFYLNSISQYNTEAFFWSLGTEWQFYMILPFFFYLQRKKGFVFAFTFVSLAVAVIAIFGILWLGSTSEILGNQIIVRFNEFGAGILTAWIFSKVSIRSEKISWLLFFTFTIVTYLGRFFLTEKVLAQSPEYYNLFKLLGFTVMSLGFGGILLAVLSSSAVLGQIFSAKYLSFIGKISYSFYIWHGLVHLHVVQFVKEFYVSTSIMAPIVSFLISVLILLPISWLSFKYLEKPFLRHTKSEEVSSN